MVNPQIFRQYDIRGLVDSDLTADSVYEIGWGFGTHLRNLNLKTAVIGGDARLSTPQFKRKFSEGLRDAGIDVTDVGFVATPVLYFAIWHLKTDAGVMITASHNPSEYNGIKLNRGLQSVYGDEIQEILKLILEGNFRKGSGKLSIFENIGEIYIEYLLQNIRLERPVKLIIDAGNGAGGPYLLPILERLGCQVECLFCEPDGRFPNHHPDPTVEKNLQQLISRVRETGAEVGIGLDGDADRMGVVDEKGKMLFGDQVLNIFVRDFLKQNPGEKIIADVKCSKNLFDDIKKFGGEPIMYKTGHANIKTRMQELDIKLSGEMSGHIFFNDRYLGFDDAIYGACRFLEIMSKTDMPVSEFLADQPRMFNTPELHIPSTDDAKFKVVEQVRNSFLAEGYDVNDIDGMRMTFKDGWALCRASNTTPVLVLRFEAETEARLAEIRQLVEERINKFL
ncbi:MAG: phosphomannomutase/phosphoglucomutase [Candidatus Cloacimonetes bacterium]|nr:phosphomannomutase/phosphoglucomutase [Candidatus Cloacimonadota bacterium]